MKACKCTEGTIGIAPTKVFIKLLEGGYLPTKAHDTDAGYDVRAVVAKTIRLHPGKSTMVKTGFCMELPVGYEAQIRPRSGLAYKHSVTVTNAPGTIDFGYQNEVGVLLINHGHDTFEINNGDRIAQMVINKLPDVELKVVKGLSQSERGLGGFGSTGTK